ncbi:unnamed protein product [Leptosia nina]|uniref:Sushi domain-containing protein n=1 Tax=Leptosia nina TaxID=320188 RepID=A0AAV1J5A3_9NEOP
MYFTCSVLTVLSLGCIIPSEAYLDLNRVQKIATDLSPIENRILRNNRRSILKHNYASRDNIHKHSHYAPLVGVRHSDDSTLLNSRLALQEANKPREDPKLFYQSDAYLAEMKDKNVNEVASVYPGQEVVRFENQINRPGRPREMIKSLALDSDDASLCVRCPQEKTLIGKAGLDKVFFEKPRLVSCTGRRAPERVRFEHLHGPKFGSLLREGQHIILGHIVQKNKVLRLCKMQINVILQSCLVPKELQVHCNNKNNLCNFTCRDPMVELKGSRALACKDSLTWNGDLPTCKDRHWCKPQQPPEHGKISCKGGTDERRGLLEGSRCRVRCAYGWRASPTAVAICRHGKWNNELKCQSRHKIR